MFHDIYYGIQTYIKYIHPKNGTSLFSYRIYSFNLLLKLKLQQPYFKFQTSLKQYAVHRDSAIDSNTNKQ